MGQNLKLKKIFRNGNSAVVGLDRKNLEAANMELGDWVTLEISAGKIIISKVKVEKEAE